MERVFKKRGNYENKRRSCSRNAAGCWANALGRYRRNPECENEFFTCDACGGTKSLAGSVQYGHYRLCNDCVLFAEVGFELGQIKDIEELIAAMDDKRLEADCEFLKQEEKRLEN